MKDKKNINVSIQRQEPRYCLFEEVYPTFLQLFSDIKRDGFTEKRRVDGHLLSKLVFSQKGDNFIMILAELFSDSIVHVSKLHDKLGIHQGTIQRYLDELKRFQIITKTPVVSLPGVTPGLQSRLVFYHLPAISTDHLLKYVENSFPEMLGKYEKVVEERSMKRVCPICRKIYDNGRETCPLCFTKEVVYLIEEEDKKTCPICKKVYTLRYGYCQDCTKDVPVKLVVA